MYRSAISAAVAVALGIALPASAESDMAGVVRDRDAELARQPSWASPPLEKLRQRALEWSRKTAPEEAREEMLLRVEAIWEQLATRDSLGDTIDAAMQTAATVDPRAAALRAEAGRPDGLSARPLDWLDSATSDDFGQNAVRLWLGRELVRCDRFDEALPLFAPLDLASSIDPASLLFFRGCCQHWLLIREGAVESFEQLLEREDEIPVRYARLARLLAADIASVESDSLDHIARRMRDVRRRLDLGHAGPEIRRVQSGVIESLDKLIADLEEQQQNQGQGGSAGAGGGGQQGSACRPMDESKIARGLGKGEVRKQDLGSGDGWGDLPPHQREAALQQIGREYPPYYREAIEQYFKRLATGQENAP